MYPPSLCLCFSFSPPLSGPLHPSTSAPGSPLLAHPSSLFTLFLSRSRLLLLVHRRSALNPLQDQSHLSSGSSLSPSHHHPAVLCPTPSSEDRFIIPGAYPPFFSPFPPHSASLLVGLLLSYLNLLLFFLAATSFAPPLFLRRPPAAFSWALLVVSAATLLASALGFCAHLSRCCFAGHTALIVASSVGQMLGFLALFLREERSLALLASRQSPRETRFLFRAKEGVLAAMFLVQSLVREYEGLEAEREVAVRKRSWRMARVQEESLANAATMAELKEKELENKMRNMYEQWAMIDGAEGRE
ncbi:hypothetical protein Taro_012915 [Colocasia esculenta]|uniref:Uncharacterized protein n=1 Tax=Colocasia esculenta TaxID=4460 RepID=A0A843UH59_COLES|nr:hypothetical protein [Colocasia esculenta]